MGTSLPQINHFLLTFLAIVVTGLCICSGSNTTGICKEEEKQALLCFKEESKFPGNWVDRADCCTEWEGVVCDNVTGHVIELHLSTYEDNLQRGKFSSCLLELKQLRYLDFSRLNFSKSHIPNFIGSFVNLQYIDLSYTRFEGIIPHQLGNLSHLHTLCLGDNHLKADSLDWLSSLSNLKVLDLSFANLSMVHNLAEVINMLPSLRELYLTDCHISKSSHPLGHNKSSLQVLDLRSNEFNTVIFRWIFNLDSLISLQLSGCGFQSPFPDDSWNLTCLSILDISGNKFGGHLPNSLWNLTSLSYLDLSENMFTGEIPKPIGKLNKLQTLRLFSNKLYGPLPENLGYSFPMLETLHIGDNMLEGIVTENHFVNLTMLGYLQASGGNRLTLNVSLNWIPPFQLLVLHLSGWKLGPQFPTWLRYQHSIGELDISNAGMQSEVPSWFWRSFQFILLNLSHNELQGKIQSISVSKSFGFSLVYLGSNQFSGPLPHISSHIIELDLSNNSFSGDISDFLCHAQNMSNNLQILHLGGNALSGEIPDCWMHWPKLRVLYMKENKLVGSIPNSIGLLNMLESLDVHKNKLSGHIPPSLQNCTSLFKIDMGDNGFTGKIPRWLGTSLSYLTILSLRSNKFYGELPLEFCHLTSLRILDLSNNHFSGLIPRCLKNFTAMENFPTAEFEISYSFYPNAFGESALVTTKGLEYEYDSMPLSLFAEMDLSSNNFFGDIPIELTNLSRLRSLNLSRNNLTGNIPTEMGNMKLLESLDLSRNQISGKIPSSFSSLCSLGVLDLSYNNLFGKIPSGTQLQSFNASCYVGNNLCGPPVSQNCSVGDGKIPKNKNKGDDDNSGVDWFYVSMAIGFAVGFWGICGSLFLVEPWRIAYFKFLDNKWKSFLAWAHALRT
ncbi:receptor-like protein EIX2 [Ipomoea triloba]|uniref:receptor-like protein EIX2 n=1 Tax=Ipomoea triloba TaxID=35885 RepID=UPI00125E134C|nr:receptor-like protein EIX2 [Ipomoea triloba]